MIICMFFMVAFPCYVVAFYSVRACRYLEEIKMSLEDKGGK